MERYRTGIEPFDWTLWNQLGGRLGEFKAGSLSGDAVAGGVALSMTRRWWEARGGRGRSVEDSWDVDYRQHLATLERIKDLQPAHLLALVGLPLLGPLAAMGHFDRADARELHSLQRATDQAAEQGVIKIWRRADDKPNT